MSNLATPDIDLRLSKDKLAHFLVFGLVATSILRTPKLCNLRASSLLIAIVLTSAYGGLDEFRQSLTPGRSVELADWLADTSGAILAVLIYAKWAAYRKCLEWSVPKKHKNKNS
jgi:VanZ family protein